MLPKTQLARQSDVRGGFGLPVRVHGSAFDDRHRSNPDYVSIDRALLQSIHENDHLCKAPHTGVGKS